MTRLLLPVHQSTARRKVGACAESGWSGDEGGRCAGGSDFTVAEQVQLVVRKSEAVSPGGWRRRRFFSHTAWGLGLSRPRGHGVTGSRGGSRSDVRARESRRTLLPVTRDAIGGRSGSSPSRNKWARACARSVTTSRKARRPPHGQARASTSWTRLRRVRSSSLQGSSAAAVGRHAR